MPWFVWFGIVLLITAVAAITGFKAKGTRHVSHTKLMGTARWFLLFFGLILAYLVYRGYNPA